jgi:mycothiol synthase
MDTKLPEGYYSRPVTMDDVEKVVEIYNAESRWLNGMDELSEEEVHSDWESPMFNKETDSMTVFTPDDQPVGHVELWDLRALHVHLFAYAAVHPEHKNLGIGSFLVTWLEERARANIFKAPGGTRVVLNQHVHSQNWAAKELLTRQGYQHIRDAYRMQIDFDQPPTPPLLPQGITVRSIHGEAEQRAALFARYEAFLDHFGAVEEPFEDYYKRWKYFIDHDAHYDPSMWFIALDGDEIAGISLCDNTTDGDPEMGWVGSLGVRRPWRKHGLGQALLQHSFQEFYRHGKLRAGLGVDASNLTGALRLYERAGMHVTRTMHAFELELRPGVNLIRQTLE